MTVKVNVKRLQNLLKFLEGNKRKEGTDENVLLISPEDEGIVFTVYDPNVIKQSVCSCDVTKGNRIAVSFSGLLRVLAMCKYDIELTWNKKALSFRAGNQEGTIPILPYELPEIPQLQYDRDPVPLKKVVKTFSDVPWFLGHDSRYTLAHAKITPSKVIATDGIKLLIRDIPLNISDFVDARECKALTKLPVDPVYVAETDKYIGFKSGWAEVIISKTPGAFPNYEVCIPKDTRWYIEHEVETLRRLVSKRSKMDQTTGNILIKVTKNKEAIIKSVVLNNTETELKTSSNIPKPLNVCIAFPVLEAVLAPLENPTVRFQLKEVESEDYLQPIKIVEKATTIIFMPKQL